jgi:hypothetical protein
MSVLSNPQVSYIQLEDPCELYHNVLIVLDKEAGINNGIPVPWPAGLKRSTSVLAIACTTSAAALDITQLSSRKSLEQAEL